MGDNGNVAVAQTLADALKENLIAAADLSQVYGKEVAVVEFHPNAAISFDRTAQLYNIETRAKIWSFDNIYSLQWIKDGSQLEVTSKNPKLLVLDPRSMDDDSSAQVKNAFEGTKSSQVFCIPRLNQIYATGFSKQAKDELKLCDLCDTSKPYSNKKDQASSVLMAHC